MRNTLITGLLLCLPTAVLLASASLAVLIGKLRRTLPRWLSDLPMAGPDREELHDDANSLPAEHGTVEGPRTHRVGSGDAQVRHVTGAEHRDLSHVFDRRPSTAGPTPSDLAGQAPAVFAHARPGAQGHELLGLRPVVADWCHREDEPALAQADRLDQDRAAGPGQDDQITSIDVASKDQILHRY
jgi:hypothetical protein